MLANYFADKQNYSLLWQTFKKALQESIQETNVEDLKKGWASCDDRTCLYFNLILPKVATKLDLGMDKEVIFRVDATFYIMGGQTTKVPIIFLESENDFKTTNHEVYKLCALNAPLKVLMICTDWDAASKKDLTEKYWEPIIDDYNDESKLTGYFAIIIAEWNEELIFHTHVYNEKGKVIEQDIL